MKMNWKGNELKVKIKLKWKWMTIKCTENGSEHEMKMSMKWKFNRNEMFTSSISALVHRSSSIYYHSYFSFNYCVSHYLRIEESFDSGRTIDYVNEETWNSNDYAGKHTTSLQSETKGKIYQRMRHKSESKLGSAWKFPGSILDAISKTVTKNLIVQNRQRKIM